MQPQSRHRLALTLTLTSRLSPRGSQLSALSSQLSALISHLSLDLRHACVVEQAEDDDKERRSREFEEQKKRDARLVIVRLREKLADGLVPLTPGEEMMIKESDEEERKQKLREAADRQDYAAEAEVLSNFNDDFLRSV